MKKLAERVLDRKEAEGHPISSQIVETVDLLLGRSRSRSRARSSVSGSSDTGDLSFFSDFSDFSYESHPHGAALIASESLCREFNRVFSDESEDDMSNTGPFTGPRKDKGEYKLEEVVVEEDLIDNPTSAHYTATKESNPGSSKSKSCDVYGFNPIGKRGAPSEVTTGDTDTPLVSGPLKGRRQLFPKPSSVEEPNTADQGSLLTDPAISRAEPQVALPTEMGGDAQREPQGGHIEPLQADPASAKPSNKEPKSAETVQVEETFKNKKSKRKNRDRSKDKNKDKSVGDSKSKNKHKNKSRENKPLEEPEIIDHITPPFPSPRKMYHPSHWERHRRPRRW